MTVIRDWVKDGSNSSSLKKLKLLTFSHNNKSELTNKLPLSDPVQVSSDLNVDNRQY